APVTPIPPRPSRTPISRSMYRVRSTRVRENGCSTGPCRRMAPTTISRPKVFFPPPETRTAASRLLGRTTSGLRSRAGKRSSSPCAAQSPSISKYVRVCRVAGLRIVFDQEAGRQLARPVLRRPRGADEVLTRDGDLARADARIAVQEVPFDLAGGVDGRHV